MMTGVETLQPICVGCVHLRPSFDYPPAPTCDAFPVRIPDAIWLEGFDHRAEFNGDNGVRFEVADTKRAHLALVTYEESR